MTNNNIIFIANWKMNGEKRNISDINNTIDFLKKSKTNKYQIIYCPPFTLLSTIKTLVKKSKIKVGAQNLYHLRDYGPYTGSINSKLIKSTGADYVIIGHSENRNLETNKIINKKIEVALKEKLKVIFCIGETLNEKKNKKTNIILRKQITEALRNIKKINNIIFAYEPRWAIGTGKIPKLSDLKKNFKYISKIIANLKKNQKINIIYGGSVNAQNANELIKIRDLKGFLIGSASLRSKNFIDIIKKSTN